MKSIVLSDAILHNVIQLNHIRDELVNLAYVDWVDNQTALNRVHDLLVEKQKLTLELGDYVYIQVGYLQEALNNEEH